MNIKKGYEYKKVVHFLVFVDQIGCHYTCHSFYISPGNGGVVYKVHRCIENDIKTQTMVNAPKYYTMIFLTKHLFVLSL